MSGPWPLHLSRRGGVYSIRLTLPKDLRDTTGVVDVRRSLQTKAIDVARRRCLDTEIWFRELVGQLRAMSNPTREDIEKAATRYFVLLREGVDRPRHWAADNFDNELAFNLEETRHRIRELDDQLRTNTFDGGVQSHAREMLASLPATLDGLDPYASTMGQML